MNFNHCNIDVENCTKEELEHEILRLESEAIMANNMQQALKILLNSAFGAIANEHFVLYNADVAESITLQGQDLIQHSANFINEYFKNSWHLDTEIHKNLGIEVNGQVINDVIVYMDTDSCYVEFDSILKTIVTKLDDPTIFILDFYEGYLKQKLNKMCIDYAKTWNCVENLQDFELEAIAHTGMWRAKKNYALDGAWKEGGRTEVNGKLRNGQFFRKGSKLKFVGLEVVQKSQPEFARNVMDDFIRYTFSVNGDIDMNKVVKKLRSFKSQFKLQDFDKICYLENISSYSDYVIDDRTSLKLKSGTRIGVRAAAIYNYKLNNHPKYKSKYEFIAPGSKIRYYYVNENGEDNAFGFIPGSYPIEFAPTFDYDLMFEKSVISPINSLLIAMGKKTISNTLTTVKSLW